MTQSSDASGSTGSSIAAKLLPWLAIGGFFLAGLLIRWIGSTFTDGSSAKQFYAAADGDSIADAFYSLAWAGLLILVLAQRLIQQFVSEIREPLTAFATAAAAPFNDMLSSLSANVSTVMKAHAVALFSSDRVPADEKAEALIEAVTATLGKNPADMRGFASLIVKGYVFPLTKHGVLYENYSVDVECVGKTELGGRRFYSLKETLSYKVVGIQPEAMADVGVSIELPIKETLEPIIKTLVCEVLINDAHEFSLTDTLRTKVIDHFKIKDTDFKEDFLKVHRQPDRFYAINLRREIRLEGKPLDVKIICTELHPADDPILLRYLPGLTKGVSASYAFNGHCTISQSSVASDMFGEIKPWRRQLNAVGDHISIATEDWALPGFGYFLCVQEAQQADA